MLNNLWYHKFMSVCSLLFLHHKIVFWISKLFLLKLQWLLNILRSHKIEFVTSNTRNNFVSRNFVIPQSQIYDVTKSILIYQNRISHLIKLFPYHKIDFVIQQNQNLLSEITISILWSQSHNYFVIYIYIYIKKKKKEKKKRKLYYWQFESVIFRQK